MTFDKYEYYQESVQAPDTDAEFFDKAYRELKGKTPKVLREDFCGTFAICCEWTKLGSDKTAIGVDIDLEPIRYGHENYLSKLTPDQQKAITIQENDVLKPGLAKADVSIATNFSYFIFKKRPQLRQYLANCFESLNDDGIMVMDCFGGSQCQEAIEEETEYDDFSYFWDQEGFDPVSNEALFHIHFKPKGQKKVRECFTYDWRMWSIPEIRDILEEVGFSKVHVYWEGTTDDGDGDGEFVRVEKGEECESWISYIVAEK